jgi:hypothetical protein
LPVGRGREQVERRAVQDAIRASREDALHFCGHTRVLLSSTTSSLLVVASALLLE